MMKRPFWVRSAPPQWSEGLTPPWMIKGLIGNYPGHMGKLSAFVSALDAGHVPHEIEDHDAEEIIVNLSGELDVVSSEPTRRLGPGGFFHVPPRARHAVRAAGPESAVFLIFKWTWQNRSGTTPEAKMFLVDGPGFHGVADEGGISRRRVCENQPLANGGRLVVETIRLAPQTGFPADTHEHDLMLVLLRGQMHGLGHVTAAPAVIYYPAGTAHGLMPLSPDSIEMIAFEFHPPSPGVL